MAKKNRKPAKLAFSGVKQQSEPEALFRVATPSGDPIYASGAGVPLADAVRVACGLVRPASVFQVGEDGQLIPGLVSLDSGAPTFSPLVA